MLKMLKIVLVAAVTAAAAVAVVSPGGGEAAPDSTEPEPIGDAVCLRKMALDLTYRGPTDDELQAVESGQKTLAEMADQYMVTPEFEQVIFDLFRSEFPPTDLTAEGIDVEEPARIATHVVVSDRDYREILTANYTVQPDGTTVDITDRPVAGVITTQHYMSAEVGSYRRNWAGHFLKQWAGIVLEPVTLPDDTDPNDLTPETIAEAPACASCHGHEIYGIDYLAPFANCFTEEGLYDSTCSEYDASFLLESGKGIERLAGIVANSREFHSVSVNLFYQHLFGRHIAREESDFYVSAVRAFEDSGFVARDLIRHLVTTPEYCAR